MDSDTYYEYQRRISEAYNDKNKAELERIKEELMEYDEDTKVKELKLSLHR